MSHTNTALPDNVQDDVKQFFWRNYLAHSIEGGLYMGGMAFIAAHSVLPAMVKSLGGPNWLISLTPMMMMLGAGWPTLFTAHWVETLHRVKPFVLLIGAFQRLPYLLAAISLFFWADSYPKLVLACVAFAPFVSGLVAGLSLGAWYELVCRIIPVNRRASSWAIRFIVRAAIGISAGGVIRSVLEQYPGETGYGILYLITFGFLALSYIFFATIRETLPTTTKSPDRQLGKNLRSIPGIVGADHRFRRFICFRALTAGVFIVAPFIAIHALEVIGKGESYLGFLVTAQMVGGILGSIFAGYTGDRYGGKVLLVISRILLIVLCIGLLANSFEWGFLAIFFLLGFALNLNMIGTSTLSIELCPPERRPTYMSIQSAVTVPSMLIAAAISTFIRETTGTIEPAAGCAAVVLALSLFFLTRVREPREKGRIS